MVRISLELVPRDSEGLRAELELVQAQFPSINTINIPDLTRFELRSWEATRLSKSFYKDSIPHIRAMDFDADEPFVLAEYLDTHQISEILVITGDVPKNSSKPLYSTTCLDLIAKLKREHPHLKIYSALDPYRNSVRKEYEYVQQKLNAGVDGFFTQPFFDLRLMTLYSEMMEGADIFGAFHLLYPNRPDGIGKLETTSFFQKIFSLLWSGILSSRSKLWRIQSKRTAIFILCRLK